MDRCYGSRGLVSHQLRRLKEYRDEDFSRRRIEGRPASPSTTTKQGISKLLMYDMTVTPASTLIAYHFKLAPKEDSVVSPIYVVCIHT